MWESDQSVFSNGDAVQVTPLETPTPIAAIFSVQTQTRCSFSPVLRSCRTDSGTVDRLLHRDVAVTRCVGRKSRIG